jgi:Cytochrome c3
LLSAASAADFSHRDHLGYGLKCTQCHVSVTGSTKVEDNNLPRAEACRGCHTGAVTIKSPRAMPIEHFSHAQHTKSINCLQCHRGIDTSVVTSIANFPKMADCVTCHEQGDMPNGCWQCHSKTMQLKPALHVTGFIDSHSRVKRSVDDKASCRVCHGKNFRCAGCH